MANVFDVARYILKQTGPISAMKLQKLCYYAQAWSLVWDGKVLFRERIEAWANGPVIPRLFHAHQGKFEVSIETFKGNGDVRNLTPDQRESIDAVVSYYDPIPSYELSAITHNERPWREARFGLAAGERGKREISRATMAEFYEALSAERT